LEDNYCDNIFDRDVTGSRSYPLAMLNLWVFLLSVIGRIINLQMIDEHGLLIEILLAGRGGGRRSTRREIYVIVTLSTAHPTWIFLAQNPNLLCQNPAANSLGHETALLFTSPRTPTLHKRHLSAYFKA